MKRPLGVTILGVLTLLQGLTLIVLAVLALVFEITLLTGTIPLERIHVFAVLTPGDILSAVGLAVFGVLGLVSGIGILRLRAWAWLMGMLLQGVTLATLLIGYFQGYPSYFNMLLGAIIVFYLNQRTIRQAFDVAPRSTTVASPPRFPAGGAVPDESPAPLAPQ